MGVRFYQAQIIIIRRTNSDAARLAGPVPLEALLKQYLEVREKPISDLFYV